MSASGEHHARLRPHKRVAANPLARLGGLQQEGIPLPESDAKKCAHGCQQIGAEGLGHRNQSGIAAKLQKTLVIGCDHRVSGVNCWVNWDYTRGATARDSVAQHSCPAYTRKVCPLDGFGPDLASVLTDVCRLPRSLESSLWKLRLRSNRKKTPGNHRQHDLTSL